MNDWPARLQKAADEFNAASAAECEAERRLAEAREIRLRAWGKAEAVQELFEEHLAAESLAARDNGHSEHDVTVDDTTVKAPD